MTSSQRSPLHRLHVVVAGGGIAGVETLLALRSLTRDALALSLTLVSPDDELHYRPFAVLDSFHARATRHYGLDEICEDLGVARRRDALASVDVDGHAIVTRDGERVAYDVLVLAPGARADAGLPCAHTFYADADPGSLQWIVSELEHGMTRRVAFVVPPGRTWPLPLYELALMTAERVREMGVDDAELTLVTPEDAPLALFQGAGSAAVAERLAQAQIRFLGSAYAHDYDGRTLALTPGERMLSVEHVVALPVLAGPATDGVPCDPEGFVHVDDRGRVPGVADVYAVGDATTFAVKQGGIAAQQADVAAATIARARSSRSRPRGRCCARCCSRATANTERPERCTCGRRSRAGRASSRPPRGTARGGRRTRSRRAISRRTSPTATRATASSTTPAPGSAHVRTYIDLGRRPIET